MSGAVRLILAQARAAVESGWSVSIFAERLDDVAIRAVGATPHRVWRWPWGSWTKRRVFAALAGRCARPFAVVHGHGDLLEQDLLSLHNCVHAAREAASGEPLPPSDAVGRMHSVQLNERRFRLLAANSGLMKADLERRFAIPSEMIEIIYPGFDESRFRFSDRISTGARVRGELGLGIDQPLFGLVTSGDFEKRGVPLFLRAFSTVARMIPTARALIVGKETRLGPYRALCAELEITEQVSFRAPRSDVEAYYHALDVYVHAARWEEFGMTVLEALACGVPVVCAQTVGAAELLSGEARDFVLSDMSREALSTAMLQLARDPSRRLRLSMHGPTLAAAFTLTAHGRRFVSLYERLLKK